MVYLDRASGPVRAPMRNRVGLRAPAHLTGCGKAALALLPAGEYVALTVTDTASLTKNDPTVTTAAATAAPSAR